MATRKRTKRTPKKASGRTRTAPDWAPRFLAALSETGVILYACRAAKVGRTAFYQRRDSDPEFAKAAAEAIAEACDLLELEAHRRAHDGVDDPVIHQGVPTWIDAQGRPVPTGVTDAGGRPLTVKKYSDTLLIFLLKVHNPARFRDNVKHDHAHAHSGEVTQKVEAKVEHSVSDRLAPYLDVVRGFLAGAPGSDGASQPVDSTHPAP